MTPLTITARLASPPVVTGPLLLDGILVAGMGSLLGSREPSGWAGAEEVYAAPLPLARVEAPSGWWYAASQATPHGPERMSYMHRRPPGMMALRWTSRASLNHASGPDKALRIPQYRRSAMLRIRWTCVGDRDGVARLLERVPSVGKYTAHGHGWVLRWEVDTGGPPLEAYGRELDLRHLPVDQVVPGAGRVTRRLIPLTPPYHQRARAVPCWQIVERSP